MEKIKTIIDGVQAVFTKKAVFWRVFHLLGLIGILSMLLLNIKIKTPYFEWNPAAKIEYKNCDK